VKIVSQNKQEIVSQNRKAPGKNTEGLFSKKSAWWLATKN